MSRNRPSFSRVQGLRINSRVRSESGFRLEYLILHALLRLILCNINVRNGNLRLPRGCLGCYTLIEDADDEECKDVKCEKSKFCDKVCLSYDCPKYYKLVDDADKYRVQVPQAHGGSVLRKV